MGWDETPPANSGSDIETENTKVQGNWPVIRTTVAVDHFNMSDPVSATDGQHRQVTLPKLSADPNSGAQVAETGFLYTKIWTDPSATEYTEAYYMDGEATPNIVQMTKRGQPFGAPAAWCLFDNTGANVNAFNATASSISGSGKFRITFTNEMSGTDYLVVATAVGTDAGQGVAYIVNYYNVAADTVDIMVMSLTGSSNAIAQATPVGNVSVTVYDL